MVAVAALIGPPNVGKSSLFNRLTSSRHAVVEDQPGTTRDRSYRRVQHRGQSFLLVDTAGLFANQRDELALAADQLARSAVEDADLLLVVADATLGVTTEDLAVASVVRRSNLPHLLLVNKCDSPERDQLAPEFHRLGLGTPLAVSARRGRGVAAALGHIGRRIPVQEPAPDTADLPQVAIAGRPNTGKSTLLNSLLGHERSLTSPVPGTTRDVVDAEYEWAGRRLMLLDTAGLRRRGRVQMGVERFSVIRSLRAIDRADVCVLVVDASEGVTAQDAHIAGYAADCGCGLVIAANKWELLEEDSSALHRFQDSLRVRMRFIAHAPLAQISALTGRSIKNVPRLALEVYENRALAIPTHRLNVCLLAMGQRRTARGPRGQVARLRYATQTGQKPPRFDLFFSDPRFVHGSYLRYLENGLRRQFKLEGTVVRMRARSARGQQSGGRGGRA